MEDAISVIGQWTSEKWMMLSASSASEKVRFVKPGRTRKGFWGKKRHVPGVCLYSPTVVGLGFEIAHFVLVFGSQFEAHLLLPEFVVRLLPVAAWQEQFCYKTISIMIFWPFYLFLKDLSLSLSRSEIIKTQKTKRETLYEVDVILSSAILQV